MKWFYVVAGQQVGPVSQEDFDGLMRAGTIRPDTLVWREGMPNWVPYSQIAGAAVVTEAPAADTGAAASGMVVCSECGKAFAPNQVIRVEGKFVCGTCKPIALQRLQEGAAQPRGALVAITDPDAAAEAILQRGYRLEIGDIISRAWGLVRANLGMSALAVLLVYLAMVVVQVIPIAGGFLAMILNGPFMAGLYWFFLKMHRGEQPQIGDAFAGFKRRPGQLILTSVVTSLLAFLLFVPAVAVLIFMAQSSSRPTILFIICVLLGIIPFIYLSICWVFSLPLVIDHELPFWKAMRLSRRVVHARWGSVFLLLLAAAIIGMLGFCAVCVGALVTMPVFLAAMVIAYDDIFNASAPEPVL